MSEKYISVFAAIQAKPEFLNENHENKDSALYAKGWNACNREYIDNLLDIPAADMRPVAQGEWEWSNVDGRCVLACSKCGSIMPTDHALDYIDAEDNHFCYWCGADMRTIGQRLSDISAEEDLFPELTAEEKAENKAEAKRMIGGADG